MSNDEIQLDNAILQLEREICLDSLEEFTKVMWPTLIANELLWNWHISVMCTELQIVAERVMAGEEKLYDLIINVPPGSSKSTIASIMLPAWIWTKKQSMRIFGITYAQTLSNDHSQKCRTVLESDKFKQLFPEVKLKKDNNQKSFYENEGKGYRFATSVGGTVTGLHGDLLIADDVLSASQAGSSVELEKSNSWMSSTLSTRYTNKNTGTLILIMQRLHEMDTTGYLLDTNRANIKHICLPAEETDDIAPAEYREKYIDGLLDPVRITRKFLGDFLSANGSYVFAGQMNQTPTPAEGGMFDTREIEVIDSIDPDDIKEMWLGIDKAGTDVNRKKNPMACYTAMVQMGKTKSGHFIIMDVVRGRWAADKREKIMLRTAYKHGKKSKIVLEIEPASSGKESFQNSVRNLAGFQVAGDRPTGTKIFRAEVFSTQVNVGNVKMIKGTWNKDLINELKNFPNSQFKDQVDAASMAFSRLNKSAQPRIRSLG